MYLQVLNNTLLNTLRRSALAVFFVVSLSIIRLRRTLLYTRKNAQVVASLQTSCNKAVHKLSTSYVRTGCSVFVETSVEQAVKVPMKRNFLRQFSYCIGKIS